MPHASQIAAAAVVEVEPSPPTREASIAEQVAVARQPSLPQEAAAEAQLPEVDAMQGLEGVALLSQDQLVEYSARFQSPMSPHTHR